MALPVLHRTMTLALDAAAIAQRADGDDRIPISLSSDEPIERWFGREILDHSSGAVDLTYARDGLPFLMTHEATTRAVVGRIEDIRAEGGKLRGLVRQGNNPDAGWVLKDMRDGIMPHISIGYRVMELKLESSSEADGDTYRATRWMPMEGSTVPVPADITVGVGRATSGEAHYPVTLIESRKAEGAMDEKTPATAVVATVTRDYDAERKQRNAEMVALANLAGMPETLADAIGRDISPMAYARELQDKKIASAASAPTAGVKLTPREQQEFSLVRLLHAASFMRNGQPRAQAVDAWKAGFEMEVSDTISKSLGRNGGFFIPLGLGTRAAVTGQIAGTTSLGGAGVQTTVLDMIELLRNQMVVRQAGARVLTGLTGNITFPRQITANALSWTGENPSTGNANTALTFDNVTLTPKTAMVSTAASRQGIVQFNQDLENVVREDLAQVIALGLDLAALNGLGASNQPRGVMQTTAVSTITSTFGANGAVPDWAAVIAFETQLSQNNAAGSWSWITTPGIRGKLKQTLSSTVAGASWIWASDGTMNGYPALVSNQMPSNFTYGTSTSLGNGMILGNWPELLIGEFGGGVEIIVDPYTVASQNMIQYHAIVMSDIALRHGPSFAMTQGAKTS
jgi:HK97 family phage major capsid protein